MIAKQTFCKCKSGCRTEHCKCFKNNAPCGEGCGCTDCRNSLNPIPSDDPSHDFYIDVAHEQWQNILNLYKTFEDEKPVMLFDIQEQKIYAYPVHEFKKELGQRSQDILDIQYQEALRENKVVIFVRDVEKRKLVSFSVDIK